MTGFFLNEVLLFGQGLLEWLTLSRFPYYTEGLFFTSGLLLIGVIMLWSSFIFEKQHRKI